MTALRVAGYIGLAIAAGIGLSAAVWCWIEAFAGVLRLIRLHREFCEYLIERKQWRRWHLQRRGIKA